MAKMFESGKWKKGLTAGLSLSLAALLSLGIFTACKAEKKTEEETEEEESTALPTDTQLLKNGNFEFHSEMTKEEGDLRAILNTPTSWSFSSGSPSSDTKSGLVDTKYWDSITKSSYEYASVADAYANWDKGSIYDKLFFYDKCKNSSSNSEYSAYQTAYDALADGSDEKTFFTEHAFSSVDYEDVQYLRSVKTGLGDTVALHGDTADKKMDERGVLMIHNMRTSDNVVGTAQYYTSSTTITLNAGTSAKISVWVKTAQLRHYYADLKEDGSELDGLKVTSEAGAYIGVTQTVGGTTLDQMQIKNINTEVSNPKPASGEWSNNGWEQYTVYVRASTFATTTVKLVLGLGQGGSDDRYEAVNGYALFDDATCEIIENGTFAEETVGKDDGTGSILPGTGIGYVPGSSDYTTSESPVGFACTVDSKKKAKLFDATKLFNDNDAKYKNTFAIDLYAGHGESAQITDGDDGTVKFNLTEEKSGNNTYTSADKGFPDNIKDSSVSADKKSITAVKTLDEITHESTNGYLMSIAENDFKNYPASFNKNGIILMLSTNGAAYTAKLTLPDEFKLDKDDDPLLISFFVKTSKVISGRTGASITLVDGENKTTISPFDSTKIDKVSIGTEGTDGYNEDIYDGWVQCFFFVSNDNKEAGEKTFHLEFNLGPTSIASSDKYAYGQGYAAFANFELKKLTKTELSYASTGDRAKKVSLKGIVEDTTVFDSVTASSDIENSLGTPLSFKGVLAGSNWITPNGDENVAPAGLATGLLNYKHIDNYLKTDNSSWNTSLAALAGSDSGEEAWLKIFGDNTGIKTALQPLVIMNNTGAALPSYGYFANESTISAESYQKISVRVKLSPNAKATIYLTDVSEFKDEGYQSFLSPNAPKVTYWYDDDGNICKSDPAKSEFNKDTDVIFELQPNGLYQKVDSEDKTYYANLKNYKDKDGNKVTSDDTIVFYGHEGKYYATRTQNSEGIYSFATEVKDLYENGGKDIARYDYTETTFPESKIEVSNPSTTDATDWITVTFYVHTGSVAKNYRLEIWAGDRDNKTNGIPANGYVFFDRYSASSDSNYDKLLKETVAELEDDDNIQLTDDGNLPESIAYYYTFTYYDSVDYLRYDANEDTEGQGNPYGNYKQSERSEEIISLKYDDATGERTGSPAYVRFLNYAASDVKVEPETPAEETPEETPEEEKEESSNAGNVLLIISSALLGIVLILVIILLIVRHCLEKRRRSGRARPVKEKRYKPVAKKQEEKAEPASEPEEENPFVKRRKEKEKAEAEKAAKKAAVKAAPEKPAPAEETPASEEPAPAEETPASEEPAPAEETPASEEPAPAEETPASEEPAPAEETPASEEPAPAEETPASEEPAPAEETPASEEPAPTEDKE